jgi:hypothetical protein
MFAILYDILFDGGTSNFQSELIIAMDRKQLQIYTISETFSWHLFTDPVQRLSTAIKSYD